MTDLGLLALCKVRVLFRLVGVILCFCSVILFITDKFQKLHEDYVVDSQKDEIAFLRFD